MAASLHSGIIPGAEAKKLYSYPTLSTSSDTFLNGSGAWTYSGDLTVGTAHEAVSLQTGRAIDGVTFDGTSNISHYSTVYHSGDCNTKIAKIPGFQNVPGAMVHAWISEDSRATDTLLFGVNDNTPVFLIDDQSNKLTHSRIKRGAYTMVMASTNDHWIVLSGPERYQLPATSTAQGMMSAEDKTKLDGVESEANKYVHPTYTARTGNPTANATPAFGATATVSQVVCDSLGHVTGMTNRTIKIPNTAATNKAAGLMAATDKSHLDSLVSMFNGSWTTSIDASGCLVVKAANGTQIFKIDKAGEW